MLNFVLIILGVVSFVAFAMYGVDKLKAINGDWRISEKALLLTSFFGGALGGLLGMQLFRHKTKHWYFYAVNILGIIWQLALVIFLWTKGF
jgi:uncharacterized membrane protein YsdA (DUF1294 family)